MNIVYLKYAITVAKAGSLTRAAEELFVAQPNLSRAIKELEKELGVTVFDRNSKGIKLTPDGERLIAAGKKILKEIDDVEEEFRERKNNKSVFSVSVPRASYISSAFAEFSRKLSGEEKCEVYYAETNAQRTMLNIAENGYKLGIIRYAAQYDRAFKEMLSEKGMSYELVAEFNMVLLVNKNSPLVSPEPVKLKDLESYTEIAHADLYVPGASPEEIKNEELTPDVKRRIFVFERAGQFDILSANPRAFMWVSPVSEEITSRYGLVQIKCSDNAKIYKDVLIYPSGYKLTAKDSAFIDALCTAKRRFLK